MNRPSPGITSRSLRRWLVPACLLGAACVAGAVEVDFENPSAYPAGQPLSDKADPSGAVWRGAPVFVVEAVDGRRVAAGRNVAGNNRLALDAETLGGRDTATGSYGFSLTLSIAPVADGAGAPGFQTLATLYLGRDDSGTAPLRLQVFANGRIQYHDGKKLANLPANLTLTPGDWSKLSGTIDYDRQVVLMTVNDEPDPFELPFYRTGGQKFGQVWLEAPSKVEDALFRSLYIDAVSVEAVSR